MKEIVISTDCGAVNRRIVDLGFPKNSIIAMIKRNNRYITPNGSTVIEPNDVLLVLSDNEESIEQVNLCLFQGEKS